MADIKLPPNVTVDPNTGLYVIRNDKGQSWRVNAESQAQLDQYVQSVNTGQPTTVTITDPSTGDPRTRTFDPVAIQAQKEAIARENELLTAGKRQAGILGTSDGGFQDYRTGERLTPEQAAARVQAAGLPPETLQAVQPKSAPVYAAAQQSVDATTNTPSNLAGTNAETPSQTNGGQSTNIASPTGEPNTAVTPPATTPAVSSPPSQITGVTPGIVNDRIQARIAGEVPTDTTATPADTQVAAPTAAPVSGSFITGVTPGIVNDRIQARIAEEVAADAATTPADTQVQADTPLPQAVPMTDDLPLQPTQAPEPVLPSQAGPIGTAYDDEGNLNPGWDLVDGEPVYVGVSNNVFTAADQEDADIGAAMQQNATLAKAREQRSIQDWYNQTNNPGDWRVRLRLGPGATYLYKAQSPGILAPLVASDGVIYPYTPTITTNYTATYDRKDLTHSNYRGYFYKSSAPGDISITGTFTAQDTKEAEYLLAVIHFFRSATKMFYGKDEFRGSPPPLVFLSGYGQYQFNNHPCVISSFNYNLPNNVDFIRVNPIVQGQNLVVNRNQTSSTPVSTIDTIVNRINTLTNLATGQKVGTGASGGPTDLGFVAGAVSGTDQTTYVPTKIEIQITLLPIQTRSQISQQFSLKDFANGNLLRGGFW